MRYFPKLNHSALVIASLFAGLSGVAATAASVRVANQGDVLSLERARGEGSDIKSQLASVKAIRKLSDFAVEIETSAPTDLGAQSDPARIADQRPDHEPQLGGGEPGYATS